MKTSENINELAGALAKARAEIKNPVKNKTVRVTPREGKAYSYSYAELPSVLDAITGPLANNGLVIVETISREENHLILHTRLVHSSGQWIEGAYPIFCDMTKPQVIGGALTYARRYATSAIINIASDEDDDASTTHGEDYSIAPKNGNGQKPFPNGNPDVKYTKTTATTPRAAMATDNNAFYVKLQKEIDELKTKDEGRAWKAMRELDLQERVSPEAMLHLSERYETQMAALP